MGVLGTGGSDGRFAREHIPALGLRGELVTGAGALALHSGQSVVHVPTPERLEVAHVPRTLPQGE